MSRLNQTAFDLLDAELQRSISGNSADLAYQFAKERLQRLCHADGVPANYQELRKILIDLAPKIRTSTLRKAAAANCPKVSLYCRMSHWFDWNPLTVSMILGTAGLVALPFMRLPLPPIAPMTTTIAEVNPSRSNEIIQTATAFASITQQSMKSQSLSVQEWRIVIEQWQESIDLLQQVSSQAKDYPTAQNLIQQYQQQQAQAKQRQQTEKASAQAFKVAQARVKWFGNRAKKMNAAEKAQAIAQIDRQLKPVVAGTTGYEARKTLTLKMKQQMR
jgi:hypothetical protein